MSQKKAHYRLRVYQYVDGSTELVFGDGPAPENAKLLVDQDVVTVTTVTPHIES